MPSPSLIEGNVTSEALALALRAGDQALLLYSPDAGDLVRVALGKYAKGESGDFDLLLKGWTSAAAFRNRVGSGRNNLCPTLSALLFVQPYILAELLANEEAFERGLTARPRIFDCQLELQDDDGKVRSVPKDVALAWQEYIRWCVKDQPSKALSFDVRCSPEAREVFRYFYNEANALRRGRCVDVEGELSRWRENAIRVALNLWLADGVGGEITAEQAERAVRIRAVVRAFVLGDPQSRAWCPEVLTGTGVARYFNRDARAGDYPARSCQTTQLRSTRSSRLSSRIFGSAQDRNQSAWKPGWTAVGGAHPD